MTLRARSGRRANGHWTADVAASSSNDAHMPYNQDKDRLSKETRPQLPLEEMTTDIIIEQLH